MLIEFEQIRINLDKYNPTRGGSYIELPVPKWIQSKKAVSTSKTKMIYVSSIPSNAGSIRYMKKTTPVRCITTKTLMMS